jgi:hypothetical protein
MLGDMTVDVDQQPYRLNAVKALDPPMLNLT